MSTRAIIIFKNEINDKEDNFTNYSVYKHFDGYPEGMLAAIENAFQYAWKLPRFESDDFAAAFIVGNKKESGDVRISHGPKYHDDLNYIYELAPATSNSQLIIRVWDNINSYSGFVNKLNNKPMFYGRYKNWKEKIITEKEKEKEIQNHINAIKTVKNKINNLINDATATMSDLEKTYAVATVEAIEESFKIITKNVRNP